jgi:uncharacterized iron-regulated membrane protein
MDTHLSSFGGFLMESAWTLVFAAMVPFLCLGLLLWLARLEDTLTDGLPGAKATREPAPVKSPEPVSPAVQPAKAVAPAAA